MIDINQPKRRFKSLQRSSETEQTQAQNPSTAAPNSTTNTESSDSEAEGKTENTASETHELDTEYGGVKGPEPTRYGDWEKNGRCVDF